MKRYLKALLFTASLVVATFLWQWPWLALALEVCFGIGLLTIDRWSYWRFYILCGLLGAVSEIVAISGNAWSYALPQIFGIPIWLPLIWGNAAVFFVSLLPHVTKETPQHGTKK